MVVSRAEHQVQTWQISRHTFYSIGPVKEIFWHTKTVLKSSANPKELLLLLYSVFCLVCLVHFGSADSEFTAMFRTGEPAYVFAQHIQHVPGLFQEQSALRADPAKVKVTGLEAGFSNLPCLPGPGIRSDEDWNCGSTEDGSEQDSFSWGSTHSDSAALCEASGASESKHAELGEIWTPVPH